MARVRQPGAAAAASFGQSGSTYANATGAATIDAPGRAAIVAIQILSDATFTSMTAVTPSTCFNSADDGSGTGGTSFPSNQTLSAGVVVYGEWSQVVFATGAAIVYFA